MVMLRPAEEMKDSGIEWVGSVPQDWKVVPIGSCFDEVVKKNKEGLVKNALKFTYGQIVPKTNFDADEDDYVADTILNYYIVDPGTIMINGLNLNFDLISQRTGLVKERGIITSAYVGIIPKDFSVTLPDFMNYLFKAYDYRMAFHNMGGGVRKILNFTRLKSQKVCFPTITEQQAIADYLEDRCSKLDEIIAEAEKSIEEYKELKQAVIFEAVTKGLDKNAPMRESGIEWIREIPSTWNVIRIKYLLDEINNRSETGEEEPLSVSQVLGVVPSTMIAVANPASSTIGQKIVEPGDLVFNKLKAHLGVFFVSDYKGLVSPDYAVYRANDKVNPKYLEYLFHTPACITEFKKYITGVAVGLMRLYTSDLFNISIALPKRSEQERIIEYLAVNVSKYDALISEKQSLIEDLKAYKKSLIYEVVTGKRRIT